MVVPASVWPILAGVTLLHAGQHSGVGGEEVQCKNVEKQNGAIGGDAVPVDPQACLGPHFSQGCGTMDELLRSKAWYDDDHCPYVWILRKSMSAHAESRSLDTATFRPLPPSRFRFFEVVRSSVGRETIEFVSHT